MGKKFNWIMVSKTNSKTDVSINLLQGKKDRPNDKGRVSFIFRNNVDRSITSTGFVVFAIDDTRIYFTGSTKETGGYKLSKKDGSTTCGYTSANRDIIEFATYHSGDYPLMYDKENKLFYIETEV